MRQSFSHQHKGFTVYAILCGLFHARFAVRGSESLHRIGSLGGCGMKKAMNETHRAREAWRRTLWTMRSEEMDDLLTPTEETRWLERVSRDVVTTPLSLRARTRQDVLDHLAAVLAESRGEPAPG